LAALLGGCSAIAGPNWKKFLDHPSTAEAESILRVTTLRGRCVESKLPSYSEAHRLFGLIEDSNSQVFMVGLGLRHCFGGAVLEDFYRASGVFLEKNAPQFFAQLGATNIQESEIPDFALMLPLSMTDKYEEQLKEINRRIEAVSHVTGEARYVARRFERVLLDERRHAEARMVNRQ
jgi:hypothetical protein